MEEKAQQSEKKQAGSQPEKQQDETAAYVPSPTPHKLWADPRLPRIQRQQATLQMSSLVGNRALQNMLQLRRTRHPGVIDNGVLTQDTEVILGNLSGTLPRGIYVEVMAREGGNFRVKVWSGYGGQETTIPQSAFQHVDQRHDHQMDDVDMGGYGRIPEDQRLPFADSARRSRSAEQHEGVRDNGHFTRSLYGITLGGHTGTLPARTYVEVLAVNADNSRRVRVWSGYGGRETTIPAYFFPSFVRQQRTDREMDRPDMEAYALLEFDLRLPLSDSVRLQVIDNGTLTTDLETLHASTPLILSGTYVEVFEYRGNVAVFRPHGMGPTSERFLTAARAAFTSSFRSQPQISDQDTSGRPDAASQATGEVDQDVQYTRRTEPLWQSGGPQLEDIRQGALGTCYVLAAAGALLQQNPSFITSGLLQNSSPTGSTFRVRLYPEAAGGVIQGNEVIVEVDRFLPTWTIAEAGEDASAYASAHRALWPAVIEKAFAQTFLGYDNIGQGGRQTAAMRVLTGNVGRARGSGAPTSINPSGLSTSVLLARIRAEADAGAALTFSTQSSSRYYLNRGLHLVSGHAYVFRELDGDRVALFNPHGQDHPRPLTMAQVRRYVAAIIIRKEHQ